MNFLDVVLSGMAHVVLLPHLQHVIDAVDSSEQLHLGRHLGVRIVGVAVCEHRARGRRARRARRYCRRPNGRTDRCDPRRCACPWRWRAHTGSQRAHPAPRAGRSCTGLGQPVADREHRHAARRQPRSPVLEDAARALHPATAVNTNQDGKRPGPFRQVKVAGKCNAVMRGIGQTHARFDFALISGVIHGVPTPTLALFDGDLETPPWVVQWDGRDRKNKGLSSCQGPPTRIRRLWSPA